MTIGFRVWEEAMARSYRELLVWQKAKTLKPRPHRLDLDSLSKQQRCEVRQIIPPHEPIVEARRFDGRYRRVL